MSIVSAVAYPELPDQQGVSVCVPGAYVTGIDTDGDGTSDVTGTGAGEEAVSGSLVIDYEAEITSTNGQTNTATTAPVILNTGAASYGSQNNSLASTTYAAGGTRKTLSVSLSTTSCWAICQAVRTIWFPPAVPAAAPTP